MKKNLLAVVVLFIIHFYIIGSQPIEKAWELYAKKNLSEALSIAEKVLESQKDDPDVNLLIGRIFTDSQNFLKAIPHLEIAIKNDRNVSFIRAWALSYLGSCYFALEQKEKSKKALLECLEMNATKNVNDYTKGKMQLFGFDDFYKDWQRYESEHFVFHFPNPSNIQYKNQFIRERENAFKNFSDTLQIPIPKKIDIFVWNSNSEAKSFLSHDLAFSFSPLCIIHTCITNSIGHEIAHIFTFYYTRPYPIEVELITEGYAVYSDFSQRDHLSQARKIIKKEDLQNISIVKYWKNWEDISGDLSYPVAGSFVKFLIEKEGIAKFRNLLKDQRLENAEVIYGKKNIHQRIKEFEKILKEKI